MSLSCLMLVVLLIGTCSSQSDRLKDILAELFDTNMTLKTTTTTIQIQPATSKPPLVTTKPFIQKNVSTNLRPRASTGSPHSYKSCGHGKECVRKFFCSDGKMKVYGDEVIDIRFDSESVCDFLETCCSVADITNTLTLNTPVTPNGCGYSNSNGVGFKIDGNYNNEAEFGEFPWMVAILSVVDILNMTVNAYQCGGSLITPEVVLTAAHCVHNNPSKKFKVRAGEWESNKKNEPLPHHDRKVLEINIHENYNSRNLQNDIALLFLESPFEMAANVKPICLPPPMANFDMANCYATGWGKDKFEKGNYVNILKKINLPVVPNTVCQTMLRRTRLSKYFVLHSSFICAGGELNKDTCTGDGGSPLFCPIENQPNRFHQAGMVAWGIGCGQQDIPGVYVNVPMYRQWIDTKLSNKKIDTSHFEA